MQKIQYKLNPRANPMRQFLKATAIASTGFGLMGMTQPFAKIKTKNQLRVIAYK